MDAESKDDEISLIDLFAVLWQRKKFIITIVVIA
jgi:LPS O-antigen subunit length determinant protein (WzzB/FepE family)